MKYDDVGSLILIMRVRNMLYTNVWIENFDVKVSSHFLPVMLCLINIYIYYIMSGHRPLSIVVHIWPWLTGNYSSIRIAIHDLIKTRIFLNGFLK